MVALITIVVTLITFRVFLFPDTITTLIDQWADVSTYHLVAHGIQIMSVVVCIISALVWILYYRVASRSGDSFGLWLATGAWLSISVITILSLAHHPVIGCRVANMLLGYVGGLAVVLVFRNKELFISALIAAGALQSVIAILFLVNGIHPFISGTMDRATGTFDSPSLLYLMPVFILPFAVVRILTSERTLTTTYYMLCTSSLLSALVLTWERTGVLATAVGLMWLIVHYAEPKKRLPFIAMCLLLTFAVFFVRANGPLNHASSNRSIRSRFEFLKSGVATFGEHWLNGVGVGNVSLTVPNDEIGQSGDIQLTQPYNQFLFWFDEMGIFGVVLSCLFILFIYRTVKLSNADYRNALVAVWLSVSCAALFNTLFGFYIPTCGNMLFGSLLGLTMCIGSSQPKDTSNAVFADMEKQLLLRSSS
jgi:uncharacterized BrkB/YihY/UPF0761 family membrane protein